MGKRRNPPKAKVKPLRKLDKAGEERLKRLLKEWDDSGKMKTSAYYRLQSQLLGGEQ